MNPDPLYVDEDPPADLDHVSDLQLIVLGLAIALLILAIAAASRPAPTAIPGDAIPSTTGATPLSTGNLSARTSIPHTSSAGAVPPAAPAVLAGRIGHALMGGRIGWAQQSLGTRYLAMRLPRGTLVHICGPAACINRATTDYGPSSKIRPPRMADLSWWDWATVCGLPHSAGLCMAQATIHERIALPPTDTE